MHHSFLPGMKGSIQRLVVLTPESFQSFARTPVETAVNGTVREKKIDSIDSAVEASLGGLDALFMQDVYFVARDGEVEGMHSKQADWAMGAISRDPRVDVALSDASVLKNIREQMQQRTPHPFSTLELLHLYNKHSIQNQICLVGKFDS